MTHYNPGLLWLTLALFLLMIEVLSTTVILSCFTLGATFASVSGLMGASTILQWCLFVGVTVISCPVAYLVFNRK